MSIMTVAISNDLRMSLQAVQLRATSLISISKVHKDLSGNLANAGKLLVYTQRKIVEGAIKTWMS